MATSLTRDQACFLLLVAIAALLSPTCINTAATTIDTTDRSVVAPAACSTADAVLEMSTTLEVGSATASDSDDVLVFQTSWFIGCAFTRHVSPPSGSTPPVRVIIATPTQSGTYPVILFKHGFAMGNCFYTQLFESLAHHGYIVVAPQASIVPEFDCRKEMEDTANVANWIPLGLEKVLKKAMPNANVAPDASKLVMAGHSRGGKIAFTIGLGMAPTKIPSISALIALDPVDGEAANLIAKPPIVGSGCRHTPMPFPVLILGAGYSSEEGMLCMKACAPTCCNHAAFFHCTSSARIMYHLVASEYGHLDFLDDVQIWTGAMCKSGAKKAPLRDFSVKLMLAFLELALEGKTKDMDDIVKNWESAPIALEKPEMKTAENVDAQREQHSEL